MTPDFHTIQLDSELFWTLRNKKDKMAAERRKRVSWPDFLKEVIPGLKEELGEA